MTIEYGLTPQGWVGKPTPVIEAEVEQGLLNGPLGQGAADADGKIPPGTAAGQLVALIVDPVSELWQLAQDVYASFNPSQNSGASQDAVCAITGVIRQGPTYSSVTEYLTGVPGTVVPAGSQIGVATSGQKFTTLEDATIAGVLAWVVMTPYVVGDVIYSSANVYYCKSAVTSATPPASDSTHWTLLGAGTGYATVGTQATQTGALAAPSGTLTNIITPVYGWSAAYNIDNATEGTALESDTALRARRQQELSSTGNATADAIKRAVLNTTVPAANGDGVAGVLSCSVFYNDTDATSTGSAPPNMPAGMPPHSVFVLADYGGAPGDNAALEQAIGQSIYDALGAGIATTFGNLDTDHPGYGITTTVQDPQGFDQSIYWGIPFGVEIYVDATVTYNNTLPGEPSEADLTVMLKGGTLSSGLVIAGAIPTAGASYFVGKNVWASAVIAAIFASPIDEAPGALPTPGILAAWPVYIGTAPSPVTSTPVAIAQTEKAVFSTANIAITLVGSAP